MASKLFSLFYSVVARHCGAVRHPTTWHCAYCRESAQLFKTFPPVARSPIATRELRDPKPAPAARLIARWAYNTTTYFWLPAKKDIQACSK